MKSLIHFKVLFMLGTLFSQSMENKIAPTFYLQDFKNQDYFFSQRDQSIPIYLNFFATWCGPCLEELKEITILEEKYQGQIDFIIIDVTNSAKTAKPVTPLSTKQIIKKYKISSTVLNDKYAVVAKKYNINSLPVNIFINQENVIVRDIRQKIDTQIFETVLESIYDEVN